MATKVKPSRLQVSWTPQVWQVPVYVNEDTFQWWAWWGGGAWDVTWPASSTDWHLAVFDGATWKIIKDGGAPTPVVDALNSTSATSALSANQGRVLDEKIADLFWLWKFLSLWDSTTWQPISFPLATPYTYTTWDYYLVETISSATPAVNYKPNGSSYTGTASSTTESGELAVWDIYIYDGTNWLLQLNHGKSVSFSEIAWNPYDNTNLSNALWLKQDILTTQTAYTSKWTSTKVPTITTNTLWQVTAITETNIAFPVTSVNWSTWAVVLDADDISDSTTTNKFVTQTDKDTWDWKQDELVSSVNIRTINWTSILWSWDIVTPVWPTYSAWTWISIAADTISNTWVTSFNGSTWAVTYTAPVTSVNWQTWAVTLEEWITKIFTLASTSDLTNAQAAFDWYLNGGNPIIRYQYSTNFFRYYRVHLYWPYNISFTDISNNISTNWEQWHSFLIRFNYSNWTVSSIETVENVIYVSSTAPTSWTSNWRITLVI